MNLVEKKVKIRDLVPGFVDNDYNGCFAMGGKLCVRPDYQRAFVYDDRKRNLVVDTVLNGMRLGVMYWMERPDGTYEVLDGQQRTLSLLKYCGKVGADGRRTGDFSMPVGDAGGPLMYFSNLPQDKQDAFLDHELLIYVCSGTDEERREWFRRINIAGEALTDQEILNSVYSGPWCNAAKKHFSVVSGPAAQVSEDYVKKQVNRQELLREAIQWAALRDGVSVEDYMARHQNDGDDNDLWNYFRAVVDWAKAVFPNHAKERIKLLCAQDWGYLFNEYSNCSFDPDRFEQRIVELSQDKYIGRQSGIYEYLLSGEDPKKEKLLSIRPFTDTDKRRKYEEQSHKCAGCGKEFDYGNMHGDHIIPWCAGGPTEYSNLQLLCVSCNLKKGSKQC